MGTPEYVSSEQRLGRPLDHRSDIFSMGRLAPRGAHGASPFSEAKVILRLGGHSEKEYVEKTIKQFDGVMVGANLLQATPGATASLLFKLNKQACRPYYVDPMTYAFGAYVDPASGRVRTDLDRIKSDQKVRGKKGHIKRDFKSSYRKLADAFGLPFPTAVNRSVALSSNELQRRSDR